MLAVQTNVIAGFLLISLCSVVPAAESSGAGPEQEAEASGASWSLLPGETFYPVYEANPRRPQNAFGIMGAWNSDLIDELNSGASRFALRLGERFTLLRREAEKDRPWDFYLEGGFFGQFDNKHSQDAIGWDGWIGAHLAHRLSHQWATKIAFRHLSAHVGDELILRTGRERFEYTREDISLALAWTSPSRLQAYIEGGATINQGNEAEQRLLDLRFGIQRRQEEPRLWGFGTVWGADVHMFQEDDWEPSLTTTTALLIPSQHTSGVIRIGLELHFGHAVLGEFRQGDESYALLVLGYEH